MLKDVNVETWNTFYKVTIQIVNKSNFFLFRKVPKYAKNRFCKFAQALIFDTPDCCTALFIAVAPVNRCVSVIYVTIPCRR